MKYGRVTAEPTSYAPKSEGLTRRPHFRVGAVVAVALLVAFGVWVYVRGSGGFSDEPAAVRAGAVPVTASVLSSLAGASSSPIYWTGPRSGFTYELTKTADGRIFIRYLPHGVPVGAVEPYLTVGTYPVARAFAVTSALASESGAIRVVVPGGGVGFYDTSRPTNVYLAFPGENSQIEVYDPAAAEARRLVVSGDIGRVSSPARSSTSVVNAATVGRLRALSVARRHAVYWAGPRPPARYELTRAPGGHIFVRYLSSGAKVGTEHPYLTIGTYPINDAYALTKTLSRDGSSVSVPIRGGGVAFYARARPTNVYVAYPGTNIQVEVYDPVARVARRLVAANRIVPVS
jgi:hypothetical protein